MLLAAQGCGQQVPVPKGPAADGFWRVPVLDSRTARAVAFAALPQMVADARRDRPGLRVERLHWDRLKVPEHHAAAEGMMAGEARGTATWDSLGGRQLPAMAAFMFVRQRDGLWVLRVAQIVCTGDRDFIWVVNWPPGRQR
jgi:hypothetical protein